MKIFILLVILITFIFGGFYLYPNNIDQLIRNGNVEQIKKILEMNPEFVNKKNKQGMTPIFTSILKRNLKITRLLIKYGALIRIGDKNLRTPIHYAGFMDDIEIFKLLLKNGGKVDTRAIGGATPLIHSTLGNSEKFSKFLIENGAEIDIQCNSLTTPLYFAVLNNNLTLLKYLISKGADPTIRDFLDRSPLYIAVRDGYLDICNYLLKQGSEVHQLSPVYKRSLLHLAAIKGHIKIVKLLKKKGLDENQKDNLGKTPLDYAIKYHHKSMIHDKTKINSELKEKRIKKSEVVIRKLQNGSWSVQTNKRFLIFGYSELGKSPDNRSIHSGHITRSFLKNKKVYYIDLNFHPAESNHALSGQNPIYNINEKETKAVNASCSKPGKNPLINNKQKMTNITYILNEDFKRIYTRMKLKNTYFPKSNEKVKIDDMNVKFIPSYNRKKGVIIECDNITIFWLSGVNNNYIVTEKDTKAINNFKNNYSKLDIMFLGVPTGIGPENTANMRELYIESEILNPKAVFLMGKRLLERKTLNQLKRRRYNIDRILVSDNPGDKFYLKNK